MALNEITIKDDLTNDEILSRIEDMMACIETPDLRKLKRTDVGNYRGELEKRFPHLAGRYPQIFSMVMMYERTFDMNKMRFLLDMLHKRQTGEVSEMESDNAVSFKNFDDHVKDKIDYEKEREGMERAKRGEMKVDDQPNFKTNMDQETE